MGSRIMHLIISYQIAERFSITDKQAFLLGGIAPDAVSPKDLSHAKGILFTVAEKQNGK